MIPYNIEKKRFYWNSSDYPTDNGVYRLWNTDTPPIRNGKKMWDPDLDKEKIIWVWVDSYDFNNI
jgi:hypothetical protein